MKNDYTCMYLQDYDHMFSLKREDMLQIPSSNAHRVNL